MSTQQDGLPPRMQMYLFPGGGMNAGSPSVNGGDDASVIYHEYTHGLSHRLVRLANGLPALNSSAGFAIVSSLSWERPLSSRDGLALP